MTDQDPASSFSRVAPGVDLPELDARVLALWDEIDAFRTSIEMRPPESEYTFYDGPPFATGSPHYGHILQGVVKDIVPRYWTMRGHRVERRFGWDTHGLPVEMEVQKKLGVSGPREIEELGVARFNEEARELVEHTTTDWYDVTRRIGRWVDFEDDYRTMDVEFMESVWWGFKQLWDKGLVYKDFKVLPYSWGATTSLANFEVNLGGYRDVEDPSITLRLRVTAGNDRAQTGDYLLVWTTTPWTLPGNLGVAVGEDIEYVRVDDEGDHYWIARELLDAVWHGDQPPIVGSATGVELLGIQYEPPFTHFEDRREQGAFRVVSMDEVTTEDGTGLVHTAPAYGEADFLAFRTAGIDALVDPIDAEARFTDEVPEVAGLHVKAADPILMDLLRERGVLIHSGTITHSYPFCWRTDTPLIYKAIPSWYVRVEAIKDRMVELNETIHWVPDYVGARRFGNWLEDARDYAISRNRFWGTTLPIWECDECDATVCVGSRAELESFSGVWTDDLHKHILDPITWPCEACNGTMTRVPEVLDTWFDSGSMPFAQVHYPFENKERFEQSFPANFIAEGLDQTRGWFYTLLIMATGIFDTAPFQNCVVTGLVLAEDGRKMSKSLKNFPDPSLVIDEFGADALRAYLINSPVVRADPLRFAEDGVREVVRTVLFPWWNAFSFFTTYADADAITDADLAAAPPVADRPEIDRWILSVLQSLIANVNKEMEAYRLFAVTQPIIGFVEYLTNWYIRRSRRRFWSHRGGADESDKLAAFATLHEVLLTFSTVAAPVLPFMAEDIYQRLARPSDTGAPASVHLLDYPEAQTTLIDEGLEAAMAATRTVVNLGRGLRKRNELRVRQPLGRVTIVTRDASVQEAVRTHRALIAEELNVREVDIHADEADLVQLSAKADFKRLGPRFGKETGKIAGAIAALTHGDVAQLLEEGAFAVEGAHLTIDDFVITRSPREGTVVATDGPITVALDTELTPDLIVEGVARELVSRIQGLRRSGGLAVTDRVRVAWDSADASVVAAFAAHGAFIAGEVLASELEQDDGLTTEPIAIDGFSVRIAVNGP
ncbi:MAG: isoleucine--tRNA ligase [Actinomycetota bacterium]